MSIFTLTTPPSATATTFGGTDAGRLENASFPSLGAIDASNAIAITMTPHFQASS
jgi:hypothetical protein